MTTKERADIALVAKGLVAAATFIVTAVLAPGEWKLAWGLLAGVVMLLVTWVIPAFVQGMDYFFNDLDGEGKEENTELHSR